MPFLIPIFWKVGLWGVGIFAGSTVVKKWWSRKREDVEKLSIGMLGLFIVISALMFAAKLRGVLK